MTAKSDPHFLRLPATRALAERKARRPLTADEYARLHAQVPEVGLDGAPFDEASWVYPLEIPPAPRVVVLDEDPRRVSVGLANGKGRFVGVVGDAAFESACLNHPGAFVYAVGRVVERRKDDRAYLNLRPRGWVLVEVDEGTSASPAPAPRRKRST